MITLCVFSLFGFNIIFMNYPYIYTHTHKGHRTLLTKVCLVEAMAFPVVMYGCESWTIKKAKHQRIDAFDPWYWRRLLRVLDCKEIKPVHREGNQSWIFIGKTDSEASILWPRDAKCWHMEKILMLGKIKGRRRRGGRGWDGSIASLTQLTWIWANLGDGEGQGTLVCCSLYGCEESD